MGFSLGMVTEKLQGREIKGRHQKVAVDCWFTSNGRAIPRFLKYQDEEGLLHTLTDIRLRKTEKKHYAGILQHRYDCSAIVDGAEREFILLYRPDENSWHMVLPD